ncbi:hypothetical protein HZ994_18515 [Akkermansiaceae bacterium]|nr:hypothetical protein HZ994_18515 [Akkermansiaceae bacterium]
MKIIHTIAAVAVLASQSSCILITDAATRLAYDLEAGAKKLEASGQSGLEVKHRPLPFPDGVKGDYFVWLQAVRSDKPNSGTLAVGAVNGRRFGTSYHLNYMTVRKDLRIRKKAGEPTYLMLSKTGLADEANLRGDKSIEVISIR